MDDFDLSGISFDFEDFGNFFGGDIGPLTVPIIGADSFDVGNIANLKDVLSNTNFLADLWSPSNLRDFSGIVDNTSDIFNINDLADLWDPRNLRDSLGNVDNTSEIFTNNDLLDLWDPRNLRDDTGKVDNTSEIFTNNDLFDLWDPRNLRDDTGKVDNTSTVFTKNDLLDLWDPRNLRDDAGKVDNTSEPWVDPKVTPTPPPTRAPTPTPAPTRAPAPSPGGTSVGGVLGGLAAAALLGKVLGLFDSSSSDKYAGIKMPKLSDIPKPDTPQIAPVRVVPIPVSSVSQENKDLLAKRLGSTPLAHGGLARLATPLFAHGGRLDFRHGAPVRGAGTGQSDDIPALLSDGEYVIDADTVAALGDGSNKAGAEALDKFREQIRKHKRSAPHDKIPPKAKSPLAYLKEVK